MSEKDRGENLRKVSRAAAVGAFLIGAGLGPASALNLPFGLGGAGERAAAEPPPSGEATVQMAQLGDAGQRISQLEEENRRLTGKVEELSFQVLQMQEQLRKMQEDTDFRFQDLEGKGGGAGGARPASAPPGKRSDAGAPADAPATASAGDAPAAAGPPAAGAPGDEIGSLIDHGQSGSIAPGGTASGQAATPAAPPAAASGTVASIQTKNAGELYGLAYNYLLAGDYALAENSFRQYAQTYPDAKDVPDARYWLGESQFQQAKYADSAETFLNAQKDFPKSPKAPEMMLKLGMSLVKLDNRDTACVTFQEVARRYPQMSSTVKKKLQTESQAAKC